MLGELIMTTTALNVLWEPQQGVIVPAGATTPEAITACARQLSHRDTQQIIHAFNAGSYEMVSTFVWTKAVAALKKQIASLGMEFVGELLNRPDISESSSIEDSVTDYEAITLAQDLGIFSATDAMRLKHARETILHFASLGSPEMESAEMMPEEAIQCLRACIQGVLGHPNIVVAEEFSQFRRSLESRTFRSDDMEMITLNNSPYFAQRTTLGVLLAMLKTAEGAQLEHAIGNVNVVIPLLWSQLRKPERWQTGLTYAEIIAAGRRSAAQGLFAALRAVQGFDYVPEDLRSNSFTKAAKDVLKAHEGLNNFYNEPLPMNVLASLGTTIPTPAFPLCMTATLAVTLGNSYGHSFDAQAAATRVLAGLSKERWEYYLNECLPGDIMILEKLAWYSKPRDRWCSIADQYEFAVINYKTKPVEALLRSTTQSNKSLLGKLAGDMLRRYGH